MKCSSLPRSPINAISESKIDIKTKKETESTETGTGRYDTAKRKRHRFEIRKFYSFLLREAARRESSRCSSEAGRKTVSRQEKDTRRWKFYELSQRVSKLYNYYSCQFGGGGSLKRHRCNYEPRIIICKYKKDMEKTSKLRKLREVPKEQTAGNL